MTLSHKNGKIIGYYTHHKGKIEGTLNNQRLKCRWYEAPTYQPIHDAGECYFNFSKDGKSFQGKWRYGFGGNKWDGEWSGTK